MSDDITFTPEEEKIIQDAARAIFEYCAGDLMGERKRISRAEIIEVILDANRMENELKKMRRRHPLVTDNLIHRVSNGDYTKLKKIVRVAFPYASYE